MMQELVTGAERRMHRCLSPPALPLARSPTCVVRRGAMVFWLVSAFVLLAASEANAVTLRLAFPDGQPMTYGSACGGDGCLQRREGIPTDPNGEVRVPTTSGAMVEYRREGIDLALAPLSSASGQARFSGERATVVLPRLLEASAPAVDAAEAEVVARINEARGARGVPLARLDDRVSAAADLQATWLTRSSLGMPLPLLTHVGPYGSNIEFRLGEVSFPWPANGAEIAAAGMTPAEAVANWLLSTTHRDVLLAPREMLIGVAQVGSVIIVDTHPPCQGCAAAAAPAGGADRPASNSGASGPAPPRRTATAPGTSPGASGSTAGRAPSCGAEQLRVQRLRDRGGRMRVRVRVACLRPHSRYTLAVLQRPSRRNLATRSVAGAGTIALAVRPARNTQALRVKLKRDGRAVAARTIGRRSAARR